MLRAACGLVLAGILLSSCDRPGQEPCRLCHGHGGHHTGIDLAALFAGANSDPLPPGATRPEPTPVLLPCPADGPAGGPGLRLATAERVSDDRCVYYWLLGNCTPPGLSIGIGEIRLDGSGGDHDFAAMLRLLVERRPMPGGGQLTRMRWDTAALGLQAGASGSVQYLGSQPQPRPVPDLVRLGRGVATVAPGGRILLAAVDGNTWTLEFGTPPTRVGSEPTLPWLQEAARRIRAGEPLLAW